MKNRSLIAASCLLLVPFTVGCVASEDELATDERGVPEEIAVDEAEATEAAPQPQRLFGEACKDTDIYITNSRTRNGVNTAIEVRSVKFYNLTEGKWTSEDLVNGIMNFGQTLVWYDENLADAEGDTISRWRVHYRYASGGSWSSEVYQEIDTPNETCIRGASFEMTVQ
ncbi:MAG TPA: hypothetical protein VK932_04170 [Kofleriaceae bacterium]|nr:hypothetical protein [Kofleriaceae bacterium]